MNRYEEIRLQVIGQLCALIQFHKGIISTGQDGLDERLRKQEVIDLQRKRQSEVLLITPAVGNCAGVFAPVAGIEDHLI